MKNLLLKSLENIYLYDNYREFLHDYFAEIKARRRAFSHRYFAEKAGIASPTFVHQVINGTRNLTNDAIEKIIKGLSISGKEERYFAALVNYNQAKSIEQQEQYRLELSKIRESTKFYRMNSKQISYFKNYSLQIVREIVVYSDWNEDYKKLGSLVYPPITAGEAKKAVTTLLDLKLIKKIKNGYDMTSEMITSSGVAPAFLKDMRRNLLLSGVTSVDDFSPKERHASFGIVSMSDDCFDEVTAMYDEFRKTIFAKISQDTKKQKVYNMSLLLFPVSSTFNKGEENEN